MKRADSIFAGAVLVVSTYWFAAMVNPGLIGPLTFFFEAITQGAVFLGYQGAFLACLLGSASVVIEVPFAGVPFILGGIRESGVGSFLFNPWLIGLLSGVGATLGDMTSYVLGYYGRRLTDETKAEGFSRFIAEHPRATPAGLFLLASTPLPLDPAVVSLGVARFSWWRVLIPCLVGEIIFLTGVTWAGRLSIDWFTAALGVGSEITALSITSEALSVILLIIVVYLVVRLDWNAMMSKTRMRRSSEV